jgi:hypothetical protein
MYYKDPGGYDATVPWKGAADIHLPVIMEKVEMAVPKVMSALWRADPFVQITAPGGVDVDMKSIKNIERFVSWAFRNDIPGFYRTLENYLRNMFIDGTSVGKIRWERTWRRAIEVHTLRSMYMPGDINLLGEQIQALTPKSPEEMLSEIFGLGDYKNTVIDVKQLGEDEYAVEFTEDRRKLKARAQFQESDKIDEVDIKVFRNVIERDSPVIELVELEDIYLPYRSACLQSADWVAHRTWYTYDEIKTLVDNGDWKLTKAELNALKGLKRNADPESKSAALRDKVIGETGNTGTELTTKDGKIDPNQIMVWEIYVRDYVDGDDEPIDVIYFLPDEIRKIAGVEYHDETFPHGKRPFISSVYIPVPDRFYGIGMAEILYAINLEVDNVMNNTANAMAIKTNPWFLYSNLGLASNDQLLDGIAPGMGVAIADPNSVVFPAFAQEPLANFHTSFQTLLGYADRLTFSPSIGGSSNYRNAPRTARGTMALMDAAEEHLSTIVEQLQANAWKEMIAQVVPLYGRFVSIDKWYSVTGEDAPRRVSPKDLRNNYLYEFTGSLTSVNRDQQRALAAQRYMNTSNDALYQSDPHAAQARLRDYLTYMSDNQNVDHLIPKLPGEGGYSHPPMQQEHEIQAMRMNKPIDVLPIDNHQEHLAKIDAFTKSAAFEELPQHTVALIAQHRNQHEALLRQQMAMAQQGQQMQGGTSPNQAPTPGVPQQGNPAMGGELSALEGGAV